MTEFHRKIELQSPEDFAYLLSNVRRAATEQIDKDLPPIEGEDKMRSRVEELVNDYINTVFKTTAQNITINGLSPAPELLSSTLGDAAYTNGAIEEHEPFNSKLFEKAKDLARQEEELVEDIARLRRDNPAIAVENTKIAYATGLEMDDEALKRKGDMIKSEEGKKAQLGVGKLDRQEGVETNWRNGVLGLEKLKRTMPETVAKKERAERAEDYVNAPERR